MHGQVVVVHGLTSDEHGYKQQAAYTGKSGSAVRGVCVDEGGEEKATRHTPAQKSIPNTHQQHHHHHQTITTWTENAVKNVAAGRNRKSSGRSRKESGVAWEGGTIGVDRHEEKVSEET